MKLAQMFTTPWFFVFSLLLLCDIGFSLTLDVVARPSKRASNGTIGKLLLLNSGDILYTTNLTLGGVTIEAQVDFGRQATHDNMKMNE
jgi:hypothetical protein